MTYPRMTLSKFIIEDQRRLADPRPDLTSLLNDIQTACKLIAVATSRGALEVASPRPLASVANAAMLATCEAGGQLAGMLSEAMEAVQMIPAHYPRGRYLLVFDPLDGAANIDVNVPVGTIFSVLRCPDGVAEPTAADFLQPGTRQVAAGYAIYGPITMLVLTLGAGVHGFTLDPEIGAFTLTHPDMRIPAATVDFAVNVSNERHWDPPVRRYVEECIEGEAGPRGRDFNLRWITSMVVEVHHILIRGGLFIYPRDGQHGTQAEHLRLLSEANPMAMIVEQAGGVASTGRERLLDLVPTTCDQRVSVILGSGDEVGRLCRYYDEYARGDEPVFNTPLFQTRSLFHRP